MSDEIELAIIAKLRGQGCEEDETGSTSVSLAFKFRGFTFFIPKAGNDGYSPEQMRVIHNVVEAHDLELLPLDYNVVPYGSAKKTQE